jgi:complement component 1 Q subcomponent-binding protein
VPLRHYAAHAGLSDAVFRELEEEQSRSDKKEQPQAPHGWSLTRSPGGARFTLRKQFQDESLELRCALPEAKSSASESDTNNSHNLVLLVTKNGEALRFGLSVEDQELVMETVAHFKDAGIALDDTPNGDHKRTSHYPGPLIHELDSNVADNFLSYLEERGVNDDLAVFITEYAFWVEQQEYEHWLSSVGKFVS